MISGKIMITNCANASHGEESEDAGVEIPLEGLLDEDSARKEVDLKDPRCE